MQSRSSQFQFLFLVVFGFLSSLQYCLADDEKSLELTLPPKIYATVGVETGIYFSNLVAIDDLSEKQFVLETSLGKLTADRWIFTPNASDVGKHSLKVVVKSSQGKVLESKTTQLIVTSATTKAKKKVRLLIVGDSLTHASYYPNEIARLLSLPGNPDWEMLGTHRPPSAAENVAHEGYGGWTWKRFNSHYSEDAQGEKKRGSSPFVFEGESGKPELNLTRYFELHCSGNKPDFITIMLGINDCFRAPYDNQKAIDQKIELMLKEADILIAAFRKAAPQAQIGICLTTPPNSRNEAFDANYKGRYTRVGWKKIQHQLVQAQLRHFQETGDSPITIIPTELYLDTTQGYPANNAVHPNQEGYAQIGKAIYGWLKFQLARATD